MEHASNKPGAWVLRVKLTHQIVGSLSLLAPNRDLASRLPKQWRWLPVIDCQVAMIEWPQWEERSFRKPLAADCLAQTIFFGHGISPSGNATKRPHDYFMVVVRIVPLCIVRSYEYDLKPSMPTPLRNGRRHAHLLYIIYRVFKNANNESGA